MLLKFLGLCSLLRLSGNLLWSFAIRRHALIVLLGYHLLIRVFGVEAMGQQEGDRHVHKLIPCLLSGFALLRSPGIPFQAGSDLIERGLFGVIVTELCLLGEAIELEGLIPITNVFNINDLLWTFRVEVRANTVESLQGSLTCIRHAIGFDLH